MLVLATTIVLISIAVFGWLFLKRDPERYIHEQKSPINFFFRWGRLYHHFFKVGIIILFMLVISSFYKYLLDASGFFASMAGLIAGIVLAGGKELLDKGITKDDVLTSILGIILGFLAIILIFKFI